MENKYICRSHISETKTRQIIKCFSLDLTATQTAEITSLNRKTIERIYSLIRMRINEYIKETSPFKGEIEVDESFFGPKRTPGKRGRGTGNKTIVFGLFKRNGKDEFSKGDGKHINSIESFWGYTKHRIIKFKGIPNDKFEIHLKETEFRFNHRGQDLYQMFLAWFRSQPL